MMQFLFFKAQNKGYTRKSGVYVRPFNDRRPPGAAQMALKEATGKPLVPAAPPAMPPPAGSALHPKPDDNGQPKLILRPSAASSPATWRSAVDTAVFVPGGAVPADLNGLAMQPWTDIPEDWDYVDGQNDEIEEPPMPCVEGKATASGVIIQEPDARIWLVSPANQYGGVVNTFPKGGKEPNLSLQANAIKEAFEESGLKVEIDAFALDVERSTSVARYYLAHRVGGTPADMGWESQAVRLVPLGQLGDHLNRPEDKQVLDYLLARAG